MRAGLGALQMGAAVPSADFYPVTKLNRDIREIIRRDPAHSAGYEFPPGNAELRRQIARHASRQVGRSSWEEIVITTGTMEGLSLALRAVAKAGDGIAVESPTFFGILQLVNSLGMQAVEIPTDPKTGMDLSALEQAMRRKRVKACVVISNCHNPLGYVLPDTVKRDIAELSHRYEIPVLEDDMLGDAAYEEPRPRTIKSYDRGGLVLIVSSFSKVLGPGYRIGWMQAGRWQSTVEQLQFITTVAAPSLPQRVISSFLEGGGYERHLRHVRLALADRVRMASRAIAQYFPPDTRVTRPAGGFLLWVQLPPSVDAITVFDRALEHRIAVVPGPMFSASGQFGNCLRLSCGHPWSPKVEESLAILGSIAGRLTVNGRR
jgi:DNA-binding transcriptional MocR family regulator